MSNILLSLLLILTLLNAMTFAVPADLHLLEPRRNDGIATLPVFPLRQRGSNKAQATYLARNLYNISDFSIQEVGSRIILRSKSHLVEFDTVNEGVWTADEANLWNATLRPNLVQDERASAIINDLVSTHKLLPDLNNERFRFEPMKIDGSSIDLLPITNGSHQTYRLDTRASYVITVNLPNQPRIPIIGGGATFQVILGDAGRLIGYYGVWREPDQDKAIHAQVIPKTEADKIFLNMFEDPKPVNYSSSLAYYAAPLFERQKYLYPVYVYEGTIIVDGNRMSTRLATVPATHFDPFHPQTHTSTYFNSTKREHSRKIKRDDPIRECAAWSVDENENAEGFVATFRSSGFQCDHFKNDDALHTDWTTEESRGVDAADFVFYTNQANEDGLTLRDRSTRPPGRAPIFVRYDTMGPFGDLDLDWLAIAANSAIGGGGSSRWAKWKRHFENRLRMVLGYQSISFRAFEGRILAEGVIRKANILQQWCRAARMTQPASVRAAIMWVISTFSGVITRDDTIENHNTRDPVSIYYFATVYC